MTTPDPSSSPSSNAARKVPSSLESDATIAATASSLGESVGTKIGPYKLLQLIGEGGFGSVFMAQQEQPVQRKVALKIIKLGMDTRQVVARFEQERQALAMMDHPNIARVLDAGATETGRPYFVMELVKGDPIVEFCDKSSLSIPERLELFAQVCQAVQHAHTKGIIHRDIKPSNILVSRQDDRPNSKVIDFGIAKATTTQLTEKTLFTEHRQLIGTPDYMSPEQAEGSLDIDTRTDVYSLGVLLYHLLTGTTPFSGKQLHSAANADIQRIIREEEPPVPSTRLSRNTATLADIAAKRHTEPRKLGMIIRGELDWIVMKAMEKDRQRRYETANGLAMDVRRFLAGEAVVAAPPGAAYRIKKFVRRHRAAVLAGSVVACTLILGIAGTTIGMLRAIEQKSRAESAEARAQTAQDAATRQRDLAQDRLYESLIREARAIRTSRQIGYRRELFDRIRQAAAISTSKRDPAALRSEATRCLGDPIGLDPVTLSGQWSTGKVPNERGAARHAMHPFGTVAASGNPEGELAFYDTETGAVVAKLEDQGRITDLAFAYSGDRLFGIIEPAEKPGGGGEGDGGEGVTTMAEWRRSGAWALHEARPMPGLRALLETSSGVVASTSDPRGFSLTNLETGAVVGTAPSFPLALGLDGKLAALRGEDGQSVVLWDVAAGQERARLSPGLAHVRAAVFNQDANYLVCVCETGIAIYEVRRPEHVSAIRGYFHLPVFQNRTVLAIPLPQENTVRFYNVATNSDVARLSMGSWEFLCARESQVALAIGTSAQVIRLGNTAERRRLVGHAGGVPAVEFSPDGRRLASIGKDRTIRIWDASTCGQIHTLEGLAGPGQAVAFSPDGKTIAACEWDGNKVQLWSLSTNRVVLTLESGPAVETSQFACGFSPDGKYLAVTGTASRIWQLEFPGDGFAPKATTVCDIKGEIWAHQFDAASKWFCYVDTLEGQYGTHLISLDGGSLKPQRIFERAGSIQQLGYDSRSGAFVSVVGREQKTLEFWNPDSLKVVRSLPTILPGEAATASVANFRISPDSSKVAIINGTGRGVNIVDAATGQRLFALGDETGSVWWLAWSPDSTRLAVARSEGDISVWDLAKAQAVLDEAGLGAQPEGKP